MENKESLGKQALFGSFWNFIVAIIQRIGGLIFTVILARFLLPEGFGLYNLVLSVAIIFAMFTQEGIHKSLIRYLSEAIKSKSKDKERDYFKFILKLKIIILLFFSIAMAVCAYPLAYYIYNKPILFPLLLIGSIYIFAASLEQFFSSFFFAVKKIKYVAYKEIIFQVTRLLLVLMLFVWIFKDPSVENALWILILASIVTLIYTIYKSYKILPHLFKGRSQVNKKDKRRITKFSFFLSISAISIVFLGNIDTLMIGLLIDDVSYVGFYKAAFILAASVSGLLAFSQVLLPIFVQIKKYRLEEVFNRSFRYAMLISVPASFGLAVLGNYFLVLLYGHDYLNATTSLYFLAFLIVTSIQVGFFTELFSAKERPKEPINLLVGIIVLNIILNFIFIKWFAIYSLSWAITGASLATLISWLVYTIGLFYLTKKKLKIKTSVSSIIKPTIASIIMSILLIYLRNLFGNINIVNGAVLVITGVLVYTLLILLMGGVKKEDYIIIKELVNKIKVF
ncbi:MAG TPA: flippase [Candidatus Nanoarchaeia archaeon]|nr:flippase [Candidatus Nanoarchaeia archaeon]